MTDEQRLTHQLNHLLGLCAPPYTKAWRPYCIAKAEAMASKEPRVFEQLPALLAKGLSDLKPTTETPKSTAAPARSEE